MHRAHSAWLACRALGQLCRPAVSWGLCGFCCFFTHLFLSFFPSSSSAFLLGIWFMPVALILFSNASFTHRESSSSPAKAFLAVQHWERGSTGREEAGGHSETSKWRGQSVGCKLSGWTGKNLQTKREPSSLELQPRPCPAPAPPRAVAGTLAGTHAWEPRESRRRSKAAFMAVPGLY